MGYTNRVISIAEQSRCILQHEISSLDSGKIFGMPTFPREAASFPQRMWGADKRPHYAPISRSSIFAQLRSLDSVTNTSKLLPSRHTLSLT